MQEKLQKSILITLSHLTEFFQVSSLRNSSSVPSQPIQQLYDEMYMDPSSPAVTLNNSRRYSYPNSPVSTTAPSSSEIYY